MSDLFLFDDQELNVVEEAREFNVVEEAQAKVVSGLRKLFDDDEEEFLCRNFVEGVQSLIYAIGNRDASSMEKFVIALSCDLVSFRYSDLTSVSIKAMCNEFEQILATKFKDQNELDQAEYFKSEKLSLLRRAKKLLSDCNEAPQSIAGCSQEYMFDFNKRTILVHGSSSAILEVLKSAAKRAAQERRDFKVLCTDGRPGNTGRDMAMELLDNNWMRSTDIKVKLLTDSAVGYVMNEIDMVLVGADRILKSGGIINKIGTYPIALAAHNMNKPIYVDAESYKLHLDPPAQNDFQPILGDVDFGVDIPAEVEVEASTQDYTPAQYLTMFWTDIGPFYPSEVGHNLDRTFLEE